MMCVVYVSVPNFSFIGVLSYGVAYAGRTTAKNSIYTQFSTLEARVPPYKYWKFCKNRPMDTPLWGVYIPILLEILSF